MRRLLRRRIAGRRRVVAIPTAIRGLVDHEACDPHRVDADDDRRVDLDRQLDAHLVTLPEVLELRPLALGRS